MKDVLFVLVGVAVLAGLMFVSLVIGLHSAHARVRYEKIQRELKEQGRYVEWANANKYLLTSKAILNTGVLSGLPGLLLFTWLGYPQVGLVFLGIFVICLIARMPINMILYDKIYRDLK